MPTLPALDISLKVNHSPHVVVLGAGASVAACPKGDAHGKRLPVMANLVSVLGLDSLLRGAGLTSDALANFERAYDQLASSGQHADLLLEVESRVRGYFTSLQLPDAVTVYDALLLSLRPKDIIATFNWDPFLLQAYARNRTLRLLPRVVFLHGNVYLGYCPEHNMKGYLTQTCQVCGKAFQRSPLLFPITNKQYRKHPLLAGEWDELSKLLEHAYILTVFGYAAPTSDTAAREIMLKAWNTNQTRELAQIEVVDILPRQQLYERWRDFIVSHHWGAFASLRHTWQLRYPGRSSETLAFATLQQAPWADKPIPRFRRLDHLQDWIRPLLEEEQALEAGNVPFKPFRRA